MSAMPSFRAVLIQVGLIVAFWLLVLGGLWYVTTVYGGLR